MSHNPPVYLCLRPFSVFIRTDLLALDQSKTFYKPDWFDIVGAEVKCCKEAVCVIDMSSFTKFELTVRSVLILLITSTSVIGVSVS